jgi:DNA invertase Pin-like site-specific DNA recombinase
MAHGSVARPALAEIKAKPSIVAYCRVSTEEQQLHGLGLEAQFAAIQEYAARHGGCVVAHYQEAATGRRDTLKNRPELVKALAHARRSGATLVFARWDRLSRNVSVTARLLESSIDFVACDNPYANRLTIHILAAMAEYESKLRSERLKAVFALMKARGHVFKAGTITPAIVKLGNAASVDAARSRTKELYADLIPLVVAMRRSGMTGEEVAAALNRDGQRNQRGRPWTRGTVHMMLEREGFIDVNALRPNTKREIDGIPPYFANRAKVKAAYAGISPTVCKLYAAGKTTRYIANWLNGGGYKTVQWNSWTTYAVIGLLRIHEQTIRPRNPAEKRRTLDRGQRNSQRARKERVRESFSRAYPLALGFRKRGDTLREIADALNLRKVATPNRRSWRPASVASLLRWRT